MCGIAGVHRRGDAAIPKLGRLADTLLLSIENRGRDATGLLAMLPNGQVHMHREVMPAGRFVQRRKKLRTDVRTLLLHTRFATVGAADDRRNAHPQLNGGMAAIHNGTIYNHNEIFQAFGLKRHAAVDSEVIPALISYAGWEHAAEAIDLFDGGSAFAVVDEKHPDEVILARTESYPLVYFVTDELVVWASTRRAIEVAWAMTFGGKPRGGKWVDMPEWTMVRVNGSLETTTIRVVKPRPKWNAYASASRSVPMVPATRNGKKKGKKATAQLALPEVDVEYLPPALIEREPWMEEEVRSLMRYDGLDYRTAFEEVYGVALHDDDEEPRWRDDILVPGRWS